MSPDIHLHLSRWSAAPPTVGRVLVIAHRGLSGLGRPENTSEAVRAALLAGADGVEVDVRLTADGVLAVSHDPDLVRLTGAAVTVAGTPWPALSAAAAARGVRLARLEDVLELTRHHHLVVEVKRPSHPGARSQTAHALSGLLRSTGRTSARRLTVSSFSPELLREVRRLLPARGRVRTALLGHPMARPSSLLRQALEDGHDQVHPHVLSLLAAPEAVEIAHAVGVGVVPWTVNRAAQVRRLARLGVDGLITDVPQVARTAVAQAAPAAP